MNRTEHLLTCLGEECDEVGQRVAKALRFGLDETQADQPLNNAARIREEMRDLMAVYNILMRENVVDALDLRPADIDAKLAKIEKYMAISRAQGVLTEAA